MAHKRNPVGAVSVLACAKRAPGLVGDMLAAMEQEHERAAGAWQAEWGTFGELLALTGSAVAWGRDLLEGLEVDAARMRENLTQLASAGVPEAREPGRHLGAAEELIQRALAAHRNGDTAAAVWLWQPRGRQSHRDTALGARLSRSAGQAVTPHEENDD